MKRKPKSYVRPKKAFEASRIKEENELMKKYALKNKKEVWKSESKINYFRRRAKKLASSERDEQELFFNKLKGIGLNVSSLVDVLALEVQDILNRRLSSVVVEKKLATTTKSARQMITHKKILVGNQVVNSPSYIVPVELENSIKIKTKKTKKPKSESEKEESKEKPEQLEEKLKEEKNNSSKDDTPKPTDIKETKEAKE
jgi:small subunit ribosomal protein S4